MRIVYYSNAKIPSTEANSVHIMKMCQAFKDLGNEVYLIAPEISTNIDMDPFQYYGITNKFKIIKVPYPNIKGKNYIYAYKAAREIIRIKPDLAYGRNINIAFFITVMSKIHFGYELHQPIEAMGKIQRMFFKIISSSENLLKLVVISQRLKDKLCKNNFLDSNKILVAHDGADIYENKNDSSISLFFNNTNLNLGYIGQLYAGKGMEIISELVKKIPNVNFHIIGGNNEDIRKWKEKLIKYKNIHFYGYLPNSIALQYGEKMDVMIAPYSERVYGANSEKKEIYNLANWMSPLKIFEYMSLSKTIITSDLPVLREVLVQGKTAFLCNPLEISDWINTINYCIDNKKELKAMGKKANDCFKKNFTWKKRAERIIKSLNKNI